MKSNKLAKMHINEPEILGEKDLDFLYDDDFLEFLVEWSDIIGTPRDSEKRNDPNKNYR
jgi:hypothetical protein